MRLLTVFTMLLVVAGMLAACNMLGFPFSGESSGCSPQLPASYRVQATVPVGVLEVVVTDATGSPVASESVTASWNGVSNAWPQPRCPSMVQGETNQAGLVRWERMKTGPYVLYLYAGEKSASASTVVEEGKVTRVSLTRP